MCCQRMESLQKRANPLTIVGAHRSQSDHCKDNLAGWFNEQMLGDDWYNANFVLQEYCSFIVKKETLKEIADEGCSA